jgi:cysteinyl-tRNA synthetase
MRIYNTLTSQKEEFQPLGDPVRMYVCGITPYDSAHVGHAMSAVVFDVVRRYLEFRGYRVEYVQNFTDVDDKIIVRAQRLEMAPDQLAERYIQEYLAALEQLNVKKASVYPRVTQEIPEIIRFIEGLIERDYAYHVDGDVYFRVDRDDDYGKLSHRNLDDLMAGARVDIGVQKENPADFALWKAAKPGEPGWPSPWGEGRPGWHIECSAMSLRYLGERIDIHGGGQDLIFPHHENEIAQTEALTGQTPFVRYWMHNGFVQLGDQKMSKSLGNLVTIDDALARHSADAVRLFILQSHYRKPLTYTDESIAAAARGVERLQGALRGYEPTGAAAGEPSPEVARARETFITAMDDDFNTSVAQAALFDLTSEINRRRESGDSQGVSEAQGVLQELSGVLGLKLAKPDEQRDDVAAGPFIDLLLEVRRDLRQAKQYQLADSVRDRLATLGIVVEDRPDGTIWRRAESR